jgi:hypothetical protein
VIRRRQCSSVGRGATGLQSRGARVSLLSEEAQSKKGRRSRFEQGVRLSLVAGSSRGVRERGAHEAGTARHMRRATPRAVCSRHSVRSPFPVLEMEDACAQPQASKQAGAQAQTAPQGGRGPRAGSSQAGDGSAERRRSSVVVVALGQHHEKKGAAATAAAVVVEQVRLTLMALGLALMMAPVAATSEPLVELFSRALPKFEPTAPCQGLVTDRRGVDLVVIATYGCFLAQNSVQVAAVEANPRARRIFQHTLVVGAATSVVYSVWYASAISSPRALMTFVYTASADFVVILAPTVSVAESAHDLRLHGLGRLCRHLGADRLICGVGA